MTKPLTVPQLVKKLDDVFQMYVRYRDNFTCITCGKKYPKGERKELHAGHFVGRGTYSTRWDERNVNAQCAGCNLKQSYADVATIYVYSLKINEKYGKGTTDLLIAKKHLPLKLNRLFLLERIDHYTKLLKEYEQ